MNRPPGVLLAQRYRLGARIAVGGMGEVWAAQDTRLARPVAVKILRTELSSDPEFVDRFRSEARITASLNHSGIAAVYDYGEVSSRPGGPDDTAYLVMELVAGEPLSAVLARSPRLSLSRTLDVLEQSGRALQVAHARSLVHRDLKPGNILITPAGQVKITDFGIARVAHQVPITRGGMVMGTAQYLSPEQAAGQEAGPAADVYALGVVAYECLAGRRPFAADNPVALALQQVHEPPPPLPADVPAPVASLVLRMLAKPAAERYPDGAALARAVSALRQGSLFATQAAGAGPAGRPPNPGPIRPTGTSGYSHRPPHPSGVSPLAYPPGPAPAPRRRTGLAFLVVAVVLILLAVAVVVALRSTSGADGPAAAGRVGTGGPPATGTARGSLHATASDTTASDTTASDTTTRDATPPDTTTSGEFVAVSNGIARRYVVSSGRSSAMVTNPGAGYPRQDEEPR